jgi:hypothetical protein
MEYRKGCPACEHTNPQLERELKAFAQLLLDAYLENHGLPVSHSAPEAVDNSKSRGTLKTVGKKPSSDE